MDSSAALILAIAGVLVLAAVMVVATGRRRSATGRLSRETRRADSGAAETAPAAESASTDIDTIDAEARARADASKELVPAGAKAPVQYVPVDDEELGVTRRQFFNRGILTAMSVALGGFGLAMLAFLWPSSAGGFGGKIRVGSLDDVDAAFSNSEPYYNASAKVYIVPYPEEDLGNAEEVYPPAVLAGMEEGYVALYQKCVHLGCRVPWCQTSQWFECPCHGSKYNRVGEKRDGPAPRGLDRFALAVTGGGIEVDTGTVITGPPIGTNTTGQSAEGAACV